MPVLSEEIVGQTEELKEADNKSLSQRLDKTLIGSDDMDTSNMNKDLMDVTSELAKMLKQSKDFAEKEKTKVNN